MQHNRKLLIIILAFLAFISLGLPDGLLGVAWPSIRGSFGLPLDALGAVLITGTVGYLLSSSFSGRLLERMTVGTLLTLSCLATALAMLGYALAPSWWLIVALGFLSGLGGGAIDAGLNTYVATQYSARTLNWLHASFGVGATIGPLVMTVVLAGGQPWQLGYAIVGSAQLLLAACFAFSRRLWQPVAATASQDATPAFSASGLATLRLPQMWLGIAVFVIYTGVEAGVGQWAYTLLTEGRGITPTVAGSWISIYWGGLTVGRIIFGIIVSYAPLGLLLRLCLLAITLGAGMLWLGPPWLNFIGLVLLGLTLAPIFPSLISTTPTRLGLAHTANAVGYQVAGAVVGAALLPGAIGLVADTFGIERIGLALFAFAIMLLLIYELLTAISLRDSPVVESEALQPER